MALSKREQRLAFVGLTERDAALLRALRPVIEQHREALAEACCRQLETLPETNEILHARAGRERLKGFFGQYLLRITEGNFDDNYFADRQRLGHMHERTGLQPRWYLLGYGELFRHLAPLIRQH